MCDTMVDYILVNVLVGLPAADAAMAVEEDTIYSLSSYSTPNVCLAQLTFLDIMWDIDMCHRYMPKGHGSFQTILEIVCGLSQPTVSKVFMQVIDAIVFQRQVMNRETSR